MNKPLDLQIEETKERILTAINDSKLPACLVELIVKDIYSEIVLIKNNELQKSKEQYEKSLEDAKNTENTETVENTEK